MMRRAAAGELSPAAGRLGAAVFQGLDDPAEFLYLGVWTSRAALADYEAVIRSPAFEALFAGPPNRSFLQTVRPAGRDLRRAAALAATIVEAPAAATASVLATLLGAGGADGELRPGVIDYAIYQDEDRPGRLLVVHGWLAAADLERVRRTEASIVESRLQTLGAQLTRFVARSQVVFENPTGPA
jgi:quinol monooxygenase YgiN